MNRLPLIPTIIVGLAVATMIGLGIWQLQRKADKEALLDRYTAASEQSPIAYPDIPDPELHYRRATAFCLEPVSWRAVAGRNREDETGWQHIAACRTGGGEGPGMQLVAGWSESPDPPEGWQGGEVTGVITLDPEYGTKLVAEGAIAGLQPVARPSPQSIPNNHLLYAIQWFFFAGIAAIIYFLAVRRRRRDAIAPADPAR